MREAITRIVPDAQDSDLITDVIATSAGHRILLTETSNGGLGLIEQLRAHYTRDFRRFWNLVEHALGPSDYEAIDRSLGLLLQNVITEPDGAIAYALSEFRSASETQAADHALTDLRRAWADLAGPPQHLAVAVVASRFLRPGTSPDVLVQVRRLLTAWDDLETRSGAELDARVLAYAAHQLDGRITLTPDQVFSLLWPRGSQARNRHLQHWQPYITSLLHDRLLAHAVVSRPVPEIDITQEHWHDQYRNHLSTVDTVELHAPAHDRAQFADAIRYVGVVSIDRGPLRIYGHLRRIDHTGDSITARVSIIEAEQ